VNIKGLRAIYERHTLNHHQFFTDEEMRFRDTKDWRVTVFPPYALVVFILMSIPVAPRVALSDLGSKDLGPHAERRQSRCFGRSRDRRDRPRLLEPLAGSAGIRKFRARYGGLHDCRHVDFSRSWRQKARAE